MLILDACHVILYECFKLNGFLLQFLIFNSWYTWIHVM